MNINKSKKKIFSIAMILLLLMISISTVVWADYDYIGVKGVNKVIENNPSNVINKIIRLNGTSLRTSNHLYCLEQGQSMNDQVQDGEDDNGSNYKIKKYIEIDGETAKSNDGKTNTNQYNAILALILNSDELENLGHGPSDAITVAQKAVWSYFPYWSVKSGNQLGIGKSWWTGSEWDSEYKIDGDNNLDETETENKYIKDALNRYANGERAKVKLYFLDTAEDVAWQKLMIAEPGGITVLPSDLIIKKVDEDTGETLGGVQFTVKNSEGKYIVANTPNANNIYSIKEYTTDESKATKFETATDPYKDITIQNVPDGEYTIKEVYNPITGYKANEGKEVSKTKEGNTDCEVKIDNKRTKKLIIDKVGKPDAESEEEKVSAVEFVIWNDENKFIKAKGPNEDNVYIFTGYVDNGNDATRFITGDLGEYQEIIIEDLVDDIYNIREVYNGNVIYQGNEGKQWAEVKLDESTEEDYVKFVLDNEGEEIKEPEPTTVPGRITISGFVWEDISNGKSSILDNKFSENIDERVEGIKVYWKDEQGNVIKETTTGEDGSYEFVMELQFENHTYKLINEEDYNKVKGSYVEFDYNGLKYRTVTNVNDMTQENVSQGEEDEADRAALDAKFDLIANKQILDSTENGVIKTDIPDKTAVEKLTTPNYLEDYAVTATTKDLTTSTYNELKAKYEAEQKEFNIEESLYGIAESQGWVKKTTFCTEHCTAGIREHEIKRIELNDEASGASATIVIYCYGRPVVEKWNDPKGILEEQIQSYMETPIGEEFNSEDYDTAYYSANEIDGPTVQDCLNGEEKVYEWNIKNVDLGLTLREKPYTEILTNIEKVRVIMKGQEYIYYYDQKQYPQIEEEEFDYQVRFENKHQVLVYSRPLNPSDVNYNYINNTNELKVFVTYNIMAKNYSTTLRTEVQDIIYYYDNDYTIYTGEGSVTSDKWQGTDKTITYEGNTYKIAYNNKFEGTILEPGQETELDRIEFEVGSETVKQIQNEDVLLRNVAEILSYKSYYGKDTMCAESENAAGKGKEGQQYAGLDKASIPGNATPGNYETYELDTDEAPRFLLKKDDTPEGEPEYKIISGTVWEDTDNNGEDNERLGNGVKSDTEKGVANVKIELIDAETNTIAKLYRTESGEVKTRDAITYTDSNGNYTFGSNVDGQREGATTGYYYIRYTYGDADKGADRYGNVIGQTTMDNGSTTINARNYKSTIITNDQMKAITEKDELVEEEMKWHLTLADNASIAVDDLDERIAIPSLKYGNYNQQINMTAYSKPFKTQLEFTEKQESNVEADGETISGTGEKLPDDCTVFDFGIIERPREDILIDKTISQVKLTLANGQVIVNGSPTDDMDYVKAMGFGELVNSRDKFTLLRNLGMDDKVLTIEIDSELMQDSHLEVTYDVTVTNNSEIDYEYNSAEGGNERYYYYGEVPANKEQSEIKQSVEYVVDYIDENLEVNVGENAEYAHNKNWQLVSGENISIVAGQLLDNQYISSKPTTDATDRTYETLLKGGYKVLVTDAYKNLARGTSQTEKISISKLLANTTDDSTFENHVEILQINGKIARTIDRSENGSQITKTYKPGNYMPSLANRIYDDDGTLEIKGLHQQDDSRVSIIITPPTGTTNYIITYIITAVVGLIVLVGGIVFIKKKVINK